MRIYEGSPRQDFEEVFRSIGAFLDERGMRDILLLEVPDGFVVQGLVVAGSASSAWSEVIGTQTKETLTFVDDDIAKFMEEAATRRGEGELPPPTANVGHEGALRVIGRWMDEQKPKDVRAGRRVRGPSPHGRPGRRPPRAGRVHARRRLVAGSPGPDASRGKGPLQFLTRFWLVTGRPVQGTINIDSS
jgi:hypothetical protein